MKEQKLLVTCEINSVDQGNIFKYKTKEKIIEIICFRFNENITLWKFVLIIDIKFAYFAYIDI